MNKKSLRKHILAIATDIPSDVLYYDRKEDDDCPRGTIEQAIADGVVTVDEILAPLRAALMEKP